MEINPKFLAPCGLYCGVCGVYYATRDKNEKFKERLVGVYKGKLPGADDLSPEGIQCEGCLSDSVFGFCQVCPIRDCTEAKGYQGAIMIVKKQITYLMMFLCIVPVISLLFLVTTVAAD
jgi:hypothetical protein